MKIMACNHSNNSNSHLRQTSSISSSNTFKTSVDLLLSLASKHPQVKRQLIKTTLMLMASGYSNNNLSSRNKKCKVSRTSNLNNNNSHNITINQNRPQISKTSPLQQLIHKVKIPSNYSSSKQIILAAAKEILLETMLVIQEAICIQEGLTSKFKTLVVVCQWEVQIVVGKVVSNNNSNSRCIITEVTNRTNISLTTSSNSNNSMVHHIHKEATIITTAENINLQITTLINKINSSNTIVVAVTTVTMTWVVSSNR